MDEDTELAPSELTIMQLLLERSGDQGVHMQEIQAAVSDDWGEAIRSLEQREIIEFIGEMAEAVPENESSHMVNDSNCCYFRGPRFGTYIGHGLTDIG